MNLRPLGDRLLVRLEAPPEKVTAGGILLPGDIGTDKFSKRGTVEAVGEKVREVSVGETVLFSGFAGNTIPHDDELRLMREGEVLGVVTE